MKLTDRSLCSDPADLVAENRELHRLREQVVAAEALIEAVRKWLAATEGRAVTFGEGMSRADAAAAIAALDGAA